MVERKKVDHYEELFDKWRRYILTLDPELLARKIPELQEEGEDLVLSHFNRKLGVSLKDGTIHAMEDEQPVSRNEKLDVYTLFGYCKEGARLSGEWVPFEKLKNTSPFAGAFRNGILLPLARMFDGHAKELEQALVSLGGSRLSWSDVGYEVKAFACIPVRVLFWDGDEEFPAQANLLFDRASTDFIHGESIVTISGVLLDRLSQLTGIPLDESTL